MHILATFDHFWIDCGADLQTPETRWSTSTLITGPYFCIGRLGSGRSGYWRSRKTANSVIEHSGPQGHV